ncbi:MAG: ATP-binding cassette domain-containing protein [Parasporobacterium sp.]|nr:ATP-binding cassette domain-containing protein [Parasporobacterium sp.]
MSVSIQIEKQLGTFHLRVSLEAGNEILSLLGASGCGKSMTLKCIAGIEKPDRGRIVVDDVVFFDSEKHINLPVQKRRAGLMFQNYALFPNMNVRQNIYAGTARYREKEVRAQKTRQIMEQLGLDSLKDQLPSQLSGGQQQRCALARILVSDPQILMLDEPFSALDSHLRFRMEQEVREILKDFGKTVIMVSHDRDEVFRLSDQIAVMDRGGIDVFGTKKQVFADPKTRNACILTGCKNISPIRRLADYRVYAVSWGMELETEKSVGDASYIGIRHHDTNGEGPENQFLCRVISETENPFSYTVMLRLADRPDAQPFGWELDKQTWEKTRSELVTIRIPGRSIMLLEEERKD